MSAREEFVKALDYMSMCERAMHVTSMNEPCFAERRDELTSARNAVLRLYEAAHPAKAVRLPFRQELCSDTGPLDAAFVRGWNACLDAIDNARTQEPR